MKKGEGGQAIRLIRPRSEREKGNRQKLESLEEEMEE